MIRKINFTNYFPEFIHQVAIKFRFWKALQKKRFQSDIIFRPYVKMPVIKFWKRLTNFMIAIPLSEKFCCQNLITSIKDIKMTVWFIIGLIHDLFVSCDDLFVSCDDLKSSCGPNSKLNVSNPCRSRGREFGSRARGYKTFFMLNSTEHGIFPAHNC